MIINKEITIEPTEITQHLVNRNRCPNMQTNKSLVGGVTNKA
jgi:hypothetical protein